MKEPARIALNWALGLPLVAALMAWGLLPSTVWWLKLVLAISAFAMLGFLVVLSSNWMFGPVLMYELVRQTRSPRVPAMRIGYALILLLAMFLVYLSYTPGAGHERTLSAISEGAQVGEKERAAFAASFFYTFVALQFATVLILAPAMIGGSLASEKQSGTLDLLLTTDLTNREIIFGKLGSQLAYLFLLLLTGLPILSILQMLGGVDPNLLVITFLGTVMSLVTLGSVSMLGAVTSGAGDILKIAYGFGLAHAYFSFTGFLMLMNADHTSAFTNYYAILGMYAVYNAFVSIVALFCTFRWLRFRPQPQAFQRYAPRQRERRRPQRRPPRPRTPRPTRQRPPMGDRDPMLWKEIYYEKGLGDYMPGGFDKGTNWAVLLGVSGLAMLVLFVTVSLADDGNFRATFGAFWNGVICYVGVPWSQILLILLALRAATAFSREWEAKTFDSLLTTSLTDQEIIRAKWLACVWSMRFWALPLLIVYVLGLCIGGLSPFAFPLALLAFAVHVTFAVNLGLYCSVASTSTLRSTIATTVSMILIAGAHWLVALITQPLALLLSGRELADMVYAGHLWGLTLPWNLASMSFYSGDIEDLDFFLGRLLPGFFGILFYGGMAFLLRWGISRRLHRYREG